MTAAQPFDLRSRRGLIQRVVDVLRGQITSGAWPIGSRIPTEPELTVLTGVGRNTVREAVQSLVHAGLLERRQGSGTYVLANNEVVVLMSRTAESDEVSPGHTWETVLGLWAHVARLAATRRTVDQAEDLREATIDLIGDPAALVSTETSLGLAGSVPRVHPLIQAICEAAASPLSTDILVGLLIGLHAEGPTHASGQVLHAVAQRIVEGDADGAAKLAAELAILP